MILPKEQDRNTVPQLQVKSPFGFGSVQIRAPWGVKKDAVSPVLFEHVAR